MDEPKKKIPKWLCWTVLSVLGILAICGAGISLVVYSLTPPPDGPTDIPNGSRIEAIGQRFPATYDASVSQPFGDVKQLPDEYRKKFTGEISIISDSAKGKLSRISVQDGYIKDSKGKRQAIDDFLNRQSATTKVQIYSDASDFKLKLPGDEKKLEGFVGTISGISSDGYFY